MIDKQPKLSTMLKISKIDRQTKKLYKLLLKTIKTIDSTCLDNVCSKCWFKATKSKECLVSLLKQTAIDLHNARVSFKEKT